MTIEVHERAALRSVGPGGPPPPEGAGLEGDRPSWRGWLHLFAALLSIPGMTLLACFADGARTRAGVIVYGVGLCAMFAVSTTYHRWGHGTRSRSAWRRADHATIFAAIAGTCTAVALACLDTAVAVVFLMVVWAGAIAGAAMKLFGFERALRSGAIVYVALGWSAVVMTPAVWLQAGVLGAALLIAGGLVYTAGAVGFHRRWPALRPATFSYHEFWHASTIVAAALHFAAISLLVR